MNRFFTIITVAEYIIYMIIIASVWNLMNTASLIIRIDGTDKIFVLSFIVGLIFIASCIFMIYYSKKYLYNFLYFGIPGEEISPFDNLTFNLPRFKNYEEVPEPVRIMTPVYIVLGISILAFVLFFIIMVLSIINTSDGFLINSISSILRLLKPIPFLSFSIIPLQGLLLYSATMFYQIKHYEKYYNILISSETDEIDLTNELHESH